MNHLYFQNFFVSISNFLSKSDIFLGEKISTGTLFAIPAFFIAIFVPITIFLIDRNDNNFLWDKAVILEKVLGAKTIFIGLIILIIVPLLWNFSEFKSFLLILYTCSMVVFLHMIVESYKWLIVTESGNESRESFRTIKRKQYLTSLGDNQKRIIWSLTWKMEKENRNLIDERSLIKIFVKNMESMKVPDASILRNFINSLDNVYLGDTIVHEELINFCLKTASYLIHVKDQEANKESTLLDFGITIRNLYFEILKRDLKNTFTTYLFFTQTKKYLNENKVEDNDIKYFIRQLSNQFFAVLNTETDIHNVFEVFPKEWQITFSKIENKNTKSIVLEWLNSYMYWIIDRNILVPESTKSSYDITADKVTECLLPNVNLSIWSDLIAFHWSSFVQNQGETQEHAKVRNFAEGKKIFGLIHKVYGFWEETNGNNTEKRFAEERKAEIDETFNIITKINVFPMLRDIKILQKYIDEINNFDDGDDLIKKEKLNRLVSILEEIKKRMRSEKK